MPSFSDEFKIFKNIFLHFSRNKHNYILFSLLLINRYISRHYFLEHKLAFTRVDDYSSPTQLNEIAKTTVKYKLYYLFTQLISDLLFIPLFVKLSVDTIDLVMENVFKNNKIESKNGYLQISVAKGTKSIGLIFNVVIYLLINHIINIIVGISKYSVGSLSIFIFAAVILAAFFYIAFSFLLFYNKSRINKIHKQVNRTVSDSLNNIEVINVSNGEKNSILEFKKLISKFCIKLCQRNVLSATITFIAYTLFSTLNLAINMYFLTNETDYTANEYRRNSALVRNWEEIIMGLGSFYLAYKVAQADIFLVNDFLEPPKKIKAKELNFENLEIFLKCNLEPKNSKNNEISAERISNSKEVLQERISNSKEVLQERISNSKEIYEEKILEKEILEKEILEPNNSQNNEISEEKILEKEILGEKYSFKIGDLICLIENDQQTAKICFNSLLGLETTEDPILINNINIDQFTFNDLRSISNLLTEQKCIFNTTIQQNINYCNSNDKSYLIDLFKLPDLTTICGENGIFLSGGEKQKVCLIRFLSNKKPIMLMEEPFGSLDLESQKVLMDYLCENMKDVLVIVKMKECKFEKRFSRVLRL